MFRLKNSSLHLIKVLFTCFVLSLLLISCGKDENPTVQENPGPGPLKPHSVQVLNLETELAIGKEHPLMKKDIFSLFDVFFKKVIHQNHFLIDEEPAFDTKVNYKGIHNLRSIRDIQYLKLVSAIENQLKLNNLLEGREENFKLSFWVNLYNYSVIRLINKNYLRNEEPIKSILSLGQKNDQMAIFDKKIISVFGEELSLNEILESKIQVLTGKKDARYLFLLSNSSVSSVPVTPYAITPENLEESLSTFSKNALMMPRIFSYRSDEQVMSLSQIFGWYQNTFERDLNGGLLGFIQKVLNRSYPSNFETKYLSYDWSLNRADNTSSIIIGDLDQLPDTRPFPDNDDNDDGSGDTDEPDRDEMRMKPCRVYQTNPMTDILARCEIVLEMDNGSSSKSIEKVDLCLLEQKLVETKGKVRTLAGKIWDRKRKKEEDPLEEKDVYISARSADEGISFSYTVKNKLKSMISFDQETKVLNFVQKIRFIGRTYHSAKFNCHSFY